MSKQATTQDVFDRLGDSEEADAAIAATEPEPDEPTVAAEAEIDDPADQADRSPGTRRRRVVFGLVGAVVVVALGLSAFLGWRLYQADQTASAGEAALAAAKKYAVTLTTLDAKDIDKHYAEALAGSTGQFREEYSQGSAQLRQILIDNQASGKGVVLDAAIKSATKTRVEVLLFVDQSVANTVLPAPRVDRNRVQMTMELIDGRWLASNVDIV